MTSYNLSQSFNKFILFTIIKQKNVFKEIILLFTKFIDSDDLVINSFITLLFIISSNNKYTIISQVAGVSFVEFNANQGSTISIGQDENTDEELKNKSTK